MALRGLAVAGATVIALVLAHGPAPAASASGSAGQQLWASRYAVPHGVASPNAEAVSPADGTVFVAGATSSIDGGFVTVAYDPATGARLWLRHYSLSADSLSSANAIVVSPDGSTVFVTGDSSGAHGSSEYATVAYDAATGRQLWAAVHAGSGPEPDVVQADARAIVISPDGKTVYVTGYSGDAGVYDYLTIAYAASTGKKLWSHPYDDHGNDQGRAMAISPDGSVVYVTGRSFTQKTGYDDATVAYNATTGRQLWVARYNGRAGENDWAQAIAVAPDGTSVFVTGTSAGKTSGNDIATIAYRASTGKQLWAARYNGPGNEADTGEAIAASPDSGTVVVTGPSTPAASPGQDSTDWATIAYNARTGAPRWTRRFGGAGAENTSTSVLVGPHGGTVYVGGGVAAGAAGVVEQGYAETVAYSVATGAQQWKTSSYNGPDGIFSEASALALSPDGSALYMAGSTEAKTGSSYYTEFFTAAYRT